ncbi:MAG: hypothetical protein IPG50_24470 [Myxococcales bacterium]|nr:hypothetical protein [Myxococcales bacterium]
MRRLVPFLLVAALAMALAACPSPPREPPAQGPQCGLEVWAQAPASSTVEVVGSWNNWARPGAALPHERGDGWRVARVALPAGAVRYAFIVDGVWRADPLVATTAWEGDREVTFAEVPPCGAPSLRVVSTVKVGEADALVRATFHGALVPSTVSVRRRNGDAVAATVDTVGEGITLGLKGLARGKHTFLVEARDAQGRAASATASVWMTGSNTAPLENQDGIVYQVMLDRFEGDAGRLDTPKEAGARAGGTLRGLLKGIERGDFEALGVNTLWLSPLYRNPSGTFTGGTRPDGSERRFTGYHGYWPVDSRAVEPALGTEADLDALVQGAHARGLRVLFDVVPNHVHAEHPYWATRRNDDGWNAPDGRCLCGSETCPWATSIERCWFAPYLPDLDTRKEDVLARAVDDVVYWLERFDGDGLRIDAVPMMPRSTTRRIVSAVRGRFAHGGHPLYLLGETFTNEGGWDALRYNLGPMGLDGQFHFPLMWALRKAIASESTPMTAIDDAIRSGEAALAGSGAVMATMIGNHDVTRFASESDGTAAGDGFDPAPLPTSESVFAKQSLALGLVFALPGAPVIYYGDEVALPGRLDPDSRRVMPRDEALPKAALSLRAQVGRFGRLRACSDALRRGSYEPLVVERERLVFARRYAGRVAIVIATRRPTTTAATLALDAQDTGSLDGRYVDALDAPAGTFDVRGGALALTTPSLSLRVLLPEGDACAR